VAPLQPLAARFAQALDNLDGEIIDGLVNLALATGRQLARDRLDAAPEIILDIVRELLHNEPSLSGKPRLWLHPEDLNIVREHLGGEFAAAGWTLQPDDQITRGGCRVSSPSGELDATWESRWRAIRGQIRRRHADPADEDSAQ
jgi:flagellar assembly protein FliH